MTEPVKITYGAAERMPSGMVVEEAPAAPVTQGPEWPFRTSRFSVPHGARSELDQHEVVEVWMVRSGAGIVYSGGTATAVGPGESVFFPSMVPHQVETTSAEPLEVFSAWWREAAR